MELMRAVKSYMISVLIVVFVALVMLILNGITLSWLFNGRQSFEESCFRRFERQRPQGQIKVLIYSRGRSGSSFLGSLFDYSPTVLYFFEPLWREISILNHTMAEIGRRAPSELSMLFNCDLSLDWISHLVSRKVYGFLNRPGRGRFFKKVFRDSRVNNRTVTQVQERVNGHCKNRTHVVAKCVDRLQSLSFVEKIWDERFYVVFLVRDPRAVIMSRSGLRFHGNFARNEEEAKTLDKGLKFLCGSALKDIDFIRERGNPIQSNVVIIRYEDLIHDPLWMMEVLFDFVHLPIHPGVTAWLNSLSKISNETDRYTVKRDPLRVTEQWRTSINALTLETIQNNSKCRSYMELFGYIPIDFNDTQNARVNVQSTWYNGAKYVDFIRHIILGV